MTPSKRSVSLGTVGEFVRHNVSSMRREREMTGQQLADRTAGTFRALGRSAISEIERGDRRVDVDDLVALALALDVSPIHLLRPAGPDLAQIALGEALEVSLASYSDWLETGVMLDAATAELKAQIAELGHRSEVLLDQLDVEDARISEFQERLEQAEGSDRKVAELVLARAKSARRRLQEEFFDTTEQIQEFKLMLDGGRDDGDD